MKEISRAVEERMTECGIRYSKGKRRSKPIYPYFVGQLYMTSSGDESGKQEYEMLLDGFDRNPDESEMLNTVALIEKAFPAVGGYIVESGGSIIMISCDSNIPDIPTDTDADLNRIEIKLKITKWRCSNV